MTHAPYRFIPACVGNRTCCDFIRVGVPVHPRVCGEQKVEGGSAGLVNGSSPRVWGTEGHPKGKVAPVRFIPACVGNRTPPTSVPSLPAVHPRVCGEQEEREGKKQVGGGSSPRVWGTVFPSKSPQCDHRFIPACVGNSHRRHRNAADVAVHPRVCGEQAVVFPTWQSVIGSSPRVWGTALLLSMCRLLNRFIPACVGNSQRHNIAKPPQPVHPRVCGEQPVV